jgi:hypothetical protein
MVLMLGGVSRSSSLWLHPSGITLRHAIVELLVFILATLRARASRSQARLSAATSVVNGEADKDAQPSR